VNEKIKVLVNDIDTEKN